MSEENSLGILENVHSINDFITACKIFPHMENFFVAGETFDGYFPLIREILVNLDHSFESIPRDPYDLNFYFHLCNIYRLNIDHLSNFKKFVMLEKMDIVFEYLKRGIFVSSESSFAKSLKNERDEKFFNKFFTLNDDFAFYTDLNKEESLTYSAVFSCLSGQTDKSSIIKSLIMEYMKLSKEKSYEKMDKILSCFFLLRKEHTLESILAQVKSFGKTFPEYRNFEEKINSLFGVQKTEPLSDQVTRTIRTLFVESVDKFDEILYKYSGKQNAKNPKYVGFEEGGEFYRVKYDGDLFPSMEENIIVEKSEAYCIFWLIHLLSTKNIKLFLSSFQMSRLDDFLKIYSDLLGEEKSEAFNRMFVSKIKEVNLACVGIPTWLDNLYYGEFEYMF